MSTTRATASVNVAAIARNCARLHSECAPGVELCGVVKADGYGHGALASADAALAGGASWLAVASAREAVELREHGVGETRVLVMGALAESELNDALAADADVVIWSERQLDAVAAAADRSSASARVHVKLDTGMGRLGTRDPEEATRVLESARARAGVEPVGLMTHFATADDLGDGGYFERQLEAFEHWALPHKRADERLIVHAANSAATIRDARAHFDMVRCGVGIYGLDPFGEDARARELEPALELSSYVAEVKALAPGESAGYGRRFVAELETWLGVLPIGYGDGVRRGLTNNADVLVAGVRRRLVGTVSMDNVTIELDDDDARRLLGERAVLIGEQGGERIDAEEVARRLETINYEVTCGLTGRVPRHYHRDGADLRRGPAEQALERR